jgi:hypothetical protein
VWQKVRVLTALDESQNEPCGGEAVISKTAISSEHGPSVYKSETWDCEADGHYLDKLSSLHLFG